MSVVYVLTTQMLEDEENATVEPIKKMSKWDNDDNDVDLSDVASYDEYAYKNLSCTLGDYSKPSHEGYRNTIELLVGNNVVPLRSDTIRTPEKVLIREKAKFPITKNINSISLARGEERSDKTEEILGIIEDVLVEVAEHVYPVDFVISDINENEKMLFILGSPFLTTAKAAIKFDKGPITLRSGKSKISFYRILDSLCMIEKGVKNDIEPIAPTMTVNRLVLEWEEKIKLYLEREMKFDQWRSKNFKGKCPTLITTKGGIEDEGEVTHRYAISSLMDTTYWMSKQAAVRLPNLKLKTLGDRGVDFIFIGYVEYSKAFRDGVFDQHSYCFDVDDEPKTFNEAIKSRDVTFWKEAINNKMYSIMGNNTRLLTDLPPGCKPLGYKWIFKRKLKMNVKIAFLNGELDEKVYINQPQGFIVTSINFEGILAWGGAILLASKKKTCLTSSTMVSKFVALATACKEAEWLKNLILEISLWPKPIALISIYCNSTSTLAKAYSQMYNRKSRHLGVRHRMIHELIMNGVVSIKFVRSQQNLADHLTRGLARDLLLKSVKGMA
uniref:Zinc finger, CCHC-type n=1 Tax=Tanacetum cinerariifolium TaxID=118510 RepID=A0A6L2J593_TANCI|nr:zinc finger, CCHC-type [Tanacetum cinerariifolium]